MRVILITLASLIAWSIQVNANTSNGEVVRLEGTWNFKIGDDLDWAAPNFDDASWKRIQAPARWEEQGYPGYDGFAWYRRKVSIPASFANQKVILELGYIDDVDEVYFNGERIGQTGSFPPRYSTAYNAFRKYEVPLRLIKFNSPNTLAVRIYDAGLEGGIVRGVLQMYSAGSVLVPDIDLSGKWNFNKGKTVSDSPSSTILVPGQWENQGFYNYDGYAVYSRKFEMTKNQAASKMVILAGRIDDADEVYINGRYVGTTGNYQTRNSDYGHAEFRNYIIPEGILKQGENHIEIRVYDRGGEGGIMEGPIGFISQERFRSYWRSKRNR